MHTTSSNSRIWMLATTTTLLLHLLAITTVNAAKAECRRSMIMQSNDVIGVDGAGTTSRVEVDDEDGGASGVNDFKVFPVQQSNGNFQVRYGSKDGQVMWESGAQLVEGHDEKFKDSDFITKLQGDANLITWYKKGTDDEKRIWKSNKVARSDGKYYFIAEDCDSEGTMTEKEDGEKDVSGSNNNNKKSMLLCIYDDLPDDGGDIVWEVQSNEIDPNDTGGGKRKFGRRSSGASTNSMNGRGIWTSLMMFTTSAFLFGIYC